jgi:hypothetical protein
MPQMIKSSLHLAAGKRLRDTAKCIASDQIILPKKPRRILPIARTTCSNSLDTSESYATVLSGNPSKLMLMLDVN